MTVVCQHTRKLSLGACVYPLRKILIIPVVSKCVTRWDGCTERFNQPLRNAFAYVTPRSKDSTG